ncbi:MAG TPA: PQQ-binding-like beta-propeller repeat protein, partial [Candidatus Thermoplasmatota archaeon]|nr:PQQ-binding-like beta-propeller repeat protein [Candidatus Thermoplasmatota archaeon]
MRWALVALLLLSPALSAAAHPGHADEPTATKPAPAPAPTPAEPSPWTGPVQPGPWPPPPNATGNATNTTKGSKAAAPIALTYDPIVGGAGGREWLGFKADAQRTGASAARPPTAPAKKWDAKGQPGYGIASEPVVAHNLVLFADLGRKVYALDVGTSFKRWTVDVPGRVLAGLAVDDDTLIVACADGVVLGLHVLTGTERWNVSLGQRVSAAPLVANGIVYVVGEAGRVTALEAPSGAWRWNATLGPVQGGVAPLLMAGRVLVGLASGQVVALQPLTGATLWTASVGAPVTATPVGALGRVIVPNLGLTALDPNSGRVVWTKPAGAFLRSSPAAGQGMLVYGDPEGPGLMAADAFSGEPRWHAALTTFVETAPVIAGDVAMAAALDGTVAGFAVRNGTALWTADAGERVRTSPLALDGRVLVARVDGTLRMLGDADVTAATADDAAAAPARGDSFLSLLPVFAAIAAPYVLVKRVRDRMARQAKSAEDAL